MHGVELRLPGDADQHRELRQRPLVSLVHERQMRFTPALVLARPRADECAAEVRLDPRREHDAAVVELEADLHRVVGPVENRGQIAQRLGEQILQFDRVFLEFEPPVQQQQLVLVAFV